MKIGSALGFAVWGTVLGLMGYLFWTMHESQQEERRLREGLARFMEQERVARFLVKKVEKNQDSGHKRTVIWWQDVKGDGDKVPVREYVIHGDDVRFDTIQINFDPRFVKEGDPLRGRSLTLLRRIYALEDTPDGKLRVPEGGVVNLDVPDSVQKALNDPDAKRVAGEEAVPDYFKGAASDRADLEAQLWSRIWELFTDPQAAETEGVRTAQYKSVGKPLIEGKEYRLKLSRTGQLDIEGPFDPDPMATFDRGQ